MARQQSPSAMRFALAGGLVLALAAPGVAAEPFRLVTGDNYAPFTGRNLEAGGAAVGLVRAAFAAAGAEATVTFRPWSRGYALTRKGAFAATFPYVRTDERTAEMRYSQPLFAVKTLVVSAAANPVPFDGDVAALKGKRLCEPQGYDRPNPLGRLIDSGGVALTRPGKMAQCANLVRLGRADFFVPNNFTWPRLRARADLDPAAFHVAAEPVRTAPHYLIAGKGNARGEQALAVFNRGLAQLRESGRFAKLLDSVSPPS